METTIVTKLTVDRPPSPLQSSMARLEGAINALRK